MGRWLARVELGDVRRVLPVALVIFTGAQVVLPQPRPASANEAVVESLRIVLSTDPETGHRRIQLVGQGIAAYPTIDVTCDGKRRTIPMTPPENVASETAATYEVPRDIAEPMLLAAECRLFIPGREIGLPRQQLWAAWVSQATGAEAPKVFLARVLEVIDGDTIRVALGEASETVRYIGVSPPETPTRGAERDSREATEVNRTLVAGRQIRLELDTQERDRHGRLLAYVYVGDQMINAELVRRGYAQATAIPPNVRHQEVLARLQREAREQKRGLWADPSEATTPSAVSQAGRPSPRERLGVLPDSAWTCPGTQRIKGDFTTDSGEECIYHVPDGQLYGRTKPERCYATESEARRDGCRRSRR